MTSLANRQALLSLLLDLNYSFFPLTFHTLWTLFRRSKLRHLAISSSLNLTSVFEIPHLADLRRLSLAYLASLVEDFHAGTWAKKIKSSLKRCTAFLGPSLFTCIETGTHPAPPLFFQPTAAIHPLYFMTSL